MDYFDEAKNILDNANLTSDEKDLWAQAIVAQGEDAAKQFVRVIGHHAKRLRIATVFLRARLHADEPLVRGRLTAAEGALLLDIIAAEKAAQVNTSL